VSTAGRGGGVTRVDGKVDFEMQPSLSHSWGEEDLEAKARWFQSLTLQERMDLLCSFTDLALHVNPQIAESKDAQSPDGRIRILERG
jgi:hypothetical protein